MQYHESAAQIKTKLAFATSSNLFDYACRCFRDGQYEQAVGIALEARRLDKLEQTIKSSPDMVKILTYSLQVCQTLVISREFRQQVLAAHAYTSLISSVHVTHAWTTYSHRCIHVLLFL